jgi:hypothetical protein
MARKATETHVDLGQAEEQLVVVVSKGTERIATLNFFGDRVEFRLARSSPGRPLTGSKTMQELLKWLDPRLTPEEFDELLGAEQPGGSSGA